MNTKVNEDCIGCGMCASVCPEVFELGLDGFAKVVGAPDDSATKVMEAADICPVNAIEVEGQPYA